jgi:hypothetical protein
MEQQRNILAAVRTIAAVNTILVFVERLPTELVKTAKSTEFQLGNVLTS